MSIQIDFTSSAYSFETSVEHLQQWSQLGNITFVIPFVLFLQNNFMELCRYTELLRGKPLITTSVLPVVSDQQIEELQEFNNVVVRGTFDRLHLGHQILLLRSLYACKSKLIIEVKDDSILRKKDNAEMVQSLELRKDNVRKFISRFPTEVEVKVRTIKNVYGSAPSTKHVDALSVSSQSVYAAKHINQKRKNNKGYKKAAVIVTPLISEGHKISSKKIREEILRINNLTLGEYLEYRNIWDSAITGVNVLCRIKDSDLLTSEIWWERLVLANSKVSSQNGSLTLNREVFESLRAQSSSSWRAQPPWPEDQSLEETARIFHLLFSGVSNATKVSGAHSRHFFVKEFLDTLLRKKIKNKTCKRIRNMILDSIKFQTQKAAKVRSQHQAMPGSREQEDLQSLQSPTDQNWPKIEQTNSVEHTDL